ncbi:ABC transporter ATP-binding protein [Bosea sp. SSUT16]|jgi:branched-chain amino acid transport system ATP-binding protein|uniref:ABC transporter ATP-binding protein n=1 Tax=Bosea spartocytisi TaxID=2773451 RepID=A0A927EBZ7_9HYPH|nr:ABC transporter ATP-binding protein [Bosea spartocytisi]MBD3848108.1 ABC transporter ATP-binding protein [Bosea spartocytisi]MCT4473959.1 ABC transporter ATP-binding protein [Bosea spartocytisi]
MIAEPFLQIDNVSRHFGGLKAVDEVSFEVARGEIVSIIGPNGAGKTTLFNLLTGQLPPSAGTVRFEGRDIGRTRSNERARLGFGRTFQISQTLTSMSVLENGMVGAFMHERRLPAAAARAFEALERVGLAKRATDKAGSLTLGERRRLEVARALAMKPQIVLLDEVMAGLNQTEVAEIIDMVHALNATGVTFLVIEHNLKVVRAFSRRVLVINRGRVLKQGTAEEVLSDPAVVEAYVGKIRA